MYLTNLVSRLTFAFRVLLTKSAQSKELTVTCGMLEKCRSDRICVYRQTDERVGVVGNQQTVRGQITQVLSGHWTKTYYPSCNWNQSNLLQHVTRFGNVSKKSPFQTDKKCIFPIEKKLTKEQETHILDVKIHRKLFSFMLKPLRVW